MEKEAIKYRKLNEIAQQNGVVIFGTDKDTQIPASELRQSFGMSYPIYNRSFDNLNLDNAFQLYKECVAILQPDTLFVHLGDNDSEMFERNRMEFEQKYISFVEKIKTENKKARIVIVSTDNENMNKSIKYISESVRCEFTNIAYAKNWSPQQTKRIISFMETTDTERYCKEKPVLDLVKILFCYKFN